VGDPVADGLVDSLAKPGGNVTGTSFLGPELTAKRLQLFKDIVPGLSHVAALWHPHAYSDRTMATLLQDTRAAAQTLGMRLELVPADSPDELPAIEEHLQEARVVLKRAAHATAARMVGCWSEHTVRVERSRALGRWKWRRGLRLLPNGNPSESWVFNARLWPARVASLGTKRGRMSGSFISSQHSRSPWSLLGGPKI
jgi:ABC transporter substrate binding protein